MAQSLFISAENFLGDENMEEDLEQHMLDPNVVYLASDIPDNHIFEEDQAQAVCANWGQVRQYLHKERLNRGFVKQKPLPGNNKRNPKGASKGKSKSKVKNKFSMSSKATAAASTTPVSIVMRVSGCCHVSPRSRKRQG